MGVLPDVRGLNGTDLFENTKIVIELEKRASQFNGPGGDLFPRHHKKWPRANLPMDWVADIRGICTRHLPGAQRRPRRAGRCRQSGREAIVAPSQRRGAKTGNIRQAGPRGMWRNRPLGHPATPEGERQPPRSSYRLGWRLALVHVTGLAPCRRLDQERDVADV